MGIRSVTSAGRPQPAHGGAVGGGGGGGGSPKSGLMSAFGNENERESGGFIGPFGWGGGLTQDALNARAAHTQFNEKEQGAFQAIQDEMSQGHSMSQALVNVMRSQPDALHTLFAGGHLADLEKFGQAVTPPQAPKGMITKGGQYISTDANGNPVASDIPGYRADPGRAAPTKIVKGADGRQYSVDPTTNTMTPLKTSMQYDSQGNVIGSGEQPGAPAKPGKDVAPGQISQEDRRFLSVAGNVYNTLGTLRSFADVTGPIEGGLKGFIAQRFGYGDAAQGFEVLNDALEQGAMSGLLPRGQVQALKQYMSTAPSITKSSEFNTSLMNQTMDNLRSQTQSRVDTAETNFTKGGMARVNGQPIIGLPDEAPARRTEWMSTAAASRTNPPPGSYGTPPTRSLARMSRSFTTRGRVIRTSCPRIARNWMA